MQIIFILVNPAVPANVGAAARAMKTMGFSELRLVNPCDHLSKEARMLAHASNEVLENAKVFSSLKEALTDIDFVIGTTARRRTIRNRFVLLSDIPGLISSKGKSVSQTAVVFGSEESGLSNEDANQCDILSTISMATKYPSLNLSQAVMVYAYELSVLAGKKTRKAPGKPNEQSWNILKKKTEVLLDALEMPEGDLVRYKLLERMALLNEKDIYLLHSIAGKISSGLKKS
ncbi:MAG: tRNA/rRNA methyltransferase [Bacteroidales bacterium]|nr:tRNA/rRNA methyltransferase [Bacteroidales bacterium]